MISDQIFTVLSKLFSLHPSENLTRLLHIQYRQCKSTWSTSVHWSLKHHHTLRHGLNKPKHCRLLETQRTVYYPGMFRTVHFTIPHNSTGNTRSVMTEQSTTLYTNTVFLIWSHSWQYQNTNLDQDVGMFSISMYCGEEEVNCKGFFLFCFWIQGTVQFL